MTTIQVNLKENVVGGVNIERLFQSALNGY